MLVGYSNIRISAQPIFFTTNYNKCFQYNKYCTKYLAKLYHTLVGYRILNNLPKTPTKYPGESGMKYGLGELN